MSITGWVMYRTTVHFTVRGGLLCGVAASKHARAQGAELEGLEAFGPVCTRCALLRPSA